jgi:transposase
MATCGIASAPSVLAKELFAMMGFKPRVFTSLTAVSLDDLVPADHFYRHLERTLDLSFVRDLVRPCYAAGGRPSIDPVVFFKLQLVLFFERLHSERQLMRVVADRLSARWYVGYDLHEALPDHSALTKIRERYGVEAFRRFFDAILAQCQQAGLVWGAELYADATKVQANASYASYRPRFFVEAHLDALFAAGPLTDIPSVEDEAAETTLLPMASLPVAPGVDPAALTATNAERHDWLAGHGRPRRELPSPSLRCTADYSMSTTDPDATFMHHKDGGPRLGYQTHYLVDGGKARIILNALVTPAETMENEPFLDLLWRTLFRWKLHPRQVTGDKTYGTADIVAALEGADIRAYVALPRPQSGQRIYPKEAFTYDAQRDAYRCPADAVLTRQQVLSSQRIIRYQADPAICNACPRKAQCTTSDHGRSLQRSFAEADLDRVRDYRATEPYQKALRKRGVWVEPLFGEAKDWHGLRRFRLRGLEKVNGEALLTASGQNVKRLLNARGWGRRPYPGGSLGVAICRPDVVAWLTT